MNEEYNHIETVVTESATKALEKEGYKLSYEGGDIVILGKDGKKYAFHPVQILDDES